MSIVTRTGDGGETGLFGGDRTRKSHPRLHACGTVDELNATLAVLLAKSASPWLQLQILRLQQLLFRLGADLATPLTSKTKTPRMEDAHVREIDAWASAIEPELPPQTQFLLPGGGEAAVLLHLARTVCRRAERWTVALADGEPINPVAIAFLNRVSDYLYLAARKSTLDGGVKETPVAY